jgi:hypothetical protein
MHEALQRADQVGVRKEEAACAIRERIQPQALPSWSRPSRS